MVVNFNSVDWKSLGLPEMGYWLENMISHDEDIREKAYDDFYDSGVVDLHRATPYVIPFLIDFLSVEDAPKQASILQLLIVLASEATAYKDHPKMIDIAGRTLDNIREGIPTFEGYKSIDDTKKLAVELLAYFE